MRCSGCGAENPAEASFCESCGNRLGSVCRRCGHRGSAAAQFCAACGAALNVAEAELKLATVLFADIVGSTNLIAGLSPEEALERLQPAVETMCAAVRRFEGTVVRTLGDGVMAFFGAPQAQEGHALLACRAALAMQAALSGQTGGPQIRVGLHSGRLVFGAGTLDPTASQAAHGVTIHLASRVQALAEAGGICLTEDCYRLVQLHCEARPLGPRALKGFPDPVGIFLLTGQKPAVASQQFQRANLTAFRGRARELRLLQQTLEQIETSPTRVVGVSGLAGSGKSRLCFEFAEWCRGRGVPVFEARAQPYGHATPLQPVLDIMRLLLRVSASDDPAASRRRIADELLSVAPTFAADFPLLYDFLGIPGDEQPPAQLPPKARHARLLDIVRHMVRRGGAEISLILIEDLHWLDEASEDFILTLVEAVADTRTMVVLNYRPAYSAAWMQWPHFRALPLAELCAADSGALVESLIGNHPELHDVRIQIIERSGGNPFFIEELVHSLVESGEVYGEAGDYRRGVHFGQTSLPATVEAVIGARIDRLKPDEKSLLQTASVIGREFPLRVLREVLGQPLGQIAAILERLCEAELVQEQPVPEHRQFAFRHPLIHDVVYSTQLKAKRTVLHASVAEAMREFYRERSNEFAALIAYHYEAAGRPANAAHFAARAATWIGSTNPAQAIKHWQKVHTLLQSQPRSPTADSQRIMAAAQIAWLGWREGMTAEAVRDVIREGLALARESDDSMVPMLLFADGRIILASGGSADVYAARVEEALALVRKTENLGRIATLNCALSQAYGWAGLLHQAIAASDAALERLPYVDKSDHQFLGYNVEHWVLTLRARILVQLGRFADAETCLRELLSNPDQLGDPTVQFIPHLAYVELASCRGDLAVAEQHAARVVEIADRSRFPYLQLYAFACRGMARTLAGDYAGAVREFRDCVTVMRDSRASLELETQVLASLADSLLHLNEPERAAEVAAEAIELAQHRRTRLAECRALIVRGTALLSQAGPGSVDAADDLFARAERLIALTGATVCQPLLERARSGLAATVS